MANKPLSPYTVAGMFYIISCMAMQLKSQALTQFACACNCSRLRRLVGQTLVGLIEGIIIRPAERAKRMAVRARSGVSLIISQIRVDPRQRHLPGDLRAQQQKHFVLNVSFNI